MTTVAARIAGRFHPHAVSLSVLAVVLAGGALRVVGASWGLPLTLHADEWVIVEGAIDMAQRDSFEPGYFQRPDHVEMKLSYLAFVAYAQVVHGSPAEAVFALDHTPFYVISRVITALIGSFTILLAYLVGRRFSRSVGVVAAFSFAFLAPYVTHAHYATPDVPLTCAVLLTILAALRYVERPGYLNLLLGSGAVAVATAIKYPGVIAAVSVAAAVVIVGVSSRNWGRLVLHAVSAAAGFVVALFAVSPVLFTNVSAVAAAIMAETTPANSSAAVEPPGVKLWFYFSAFFDVAGVVVTTLAFLGLAWFVKRRDTRFFVIAVGIVFWVALSFLTLHWDRWALPMFITPLLLAAVGLAWAWEWACRTRLHQWARGGVVVAAGVAGLNLVTGAIASSAQFLKPDSRVHALAELGERGIRREQSLYEGYTPFLPGAPWPVFDSFVLTDDGPVVAPGAVRPRDPEPVVVDDVRYLILSSGMAGRYVDGERFPDEQAFYASAAEHLPLVFEMAPTISSTATPVEIVNIVQNLRSTWSAVTGGTTGPHIEVRELTPAGTVATRPHRVAP